MAAGRLCLPDTVEKGLQGALRRLLSLQDGGAVEATFGDVAGHAEVVLGGDPPAGVLGLVERVHTPCSRFSVSGH